MLSSFFAAQIPVKPSSLFIYFCSERRLGGARQHATACQSLHITAVIFRQLKTATRTTYRHRKSSLTHSHMISVFL